MSKEKQTDDYEQGGFVHGYPYIVGKIGDRSAFDAIEQATAVEADPVIMQLEVLESSSVQQEALLAEIRDQLISLRIDLAPMAEYFKVMTQAQDDTEANRLPIGFPAAAKLEEAGYTAVTDVPRKSSTLRHLGLDQDEITAVLTELAKGNRPL